MMWTGIPTGFFGSSGAVLLALRRRWKDGPGPGEYDGVCRERIDCLSRIQLCVSRAHAPDEGWLGWLRPKEDGQSKMPYLCWPPYGRGHGRQVCPCSRQARAVCLPRPRGCWLSGVRRRLFFWSVTADDTGFVDMAGALSTQAMTACFPRPRNAQ